MEIIEEKYNNFISFIKGLEGLPITPQVQVFLSLPFNMFMITIKKHAGDKKTNNEIFKLIIDKLNVNVKGFKDEDIFKFKRYISYFNAVSKV